MISEEAPHDAERIRSKGKYQSEADEEKMIERQEMRWIESTIHDERKKSNEEKPGSGILLLKA